MTRTGPLYRLMTQSGHFRPRLSLMQINVVAKAVP
jgi:hypothetical protein